MDLGGFIKDNWDVIAAHPVPFIVLAILFFGIGIAVAAWQNSGAHTVKDERLALAEARVADYKEKLAGASPDEAAERIDEANAS